MIKQYKGKRDFYTFHTPQIKYDADTLILSFKLLTESQRQICFRLISFTLSYRLERKKIKNKIETAQ